jgi:hypothetical protein
MLRPTGLGRRAVILALAVAGALSAKGTGVLAQTAPSVEEGSRVRITAPSLGLTEAVGIVQEATNEEIVVQFEYPRRLATVDRSDITGLDVSVERERKVLKGLGVGALVGAGTGVVIGLASGDDEGTFLAFTAEEKALVMGIGLGAVGGVVGLIVGALDRNDVWSSTLPIDLDVAVLPVLRAGGAGVHLGLALRVP